MEEEEFARSGAQAAVGLSPRGGRRRRGRRAGVTGREDGKGTARGTDVGGGAGVGGEGKGDAERRRRRWGRWVGRRRGGRGGRG